MSIALIFIRFRILMATFCPEMTCSATLTFPKLPIPNVRPSRYELRFPRWTPTLPDVSGDVPRLWLWLAICVLEQHWCLL